MKFKGSKKIVSLFLAVLMVVSSVPAFALNASAAVNTSTDVSVLRDAIDAYETKMTSGKIYTNMANAYTYYIAAQKAYDACVYGYNDAYVAKATTDLTNATNAMTEWKAYTASKWGTFDGEQDEQATEENYKKFYKNVLYSTQGGAVGTNTVNLGNRGFATATCYDKSTFYYPETVLMYDGTTDPQMGVVYSSIFDANRKYNVIQTHQAVLKSNYGGLKLANERWKGTDTRSNFIWMIQWADDDIYSTTGHESHNSKEHGENETYWSNVIKYDASAEGFASGEYLKTYKPTFSARMWNGYRSDYDNDVTSSVPIYVFNYKAVIDKVNSLAGKIPNVKNYLNGGLSTALATIDKLTTDPNSFFTSSNDINGCVDNYSNAISNVDSQLSSVTADSTGYQSLRDAIAKADTVSTAKTADSLVAYGKAIKAGRDFFANLATYTNNGDNAESLANAIKTKYNALANVDTDDAYSNFDAAVTVVNAMDTDAFIDSNTVANKVASAKAQVYTTLTDSADIEAYTLAIGTAPSGELKNSAAVDAVTKDLLDFANEPSADLIKDIAVTFGAQIQKDNKEPVTAGETSNTYKYGTMVTFDANSFADVSALGDNKSIKWTVNYADKTISKFATNTTSITIKATKGMTVTANVIDETPNTEAVNYTVKLYNIYNNIVDYVYVSEPLTAGFHEGSSINVNGKAWTIDIPFYTLTGFDVAVYESSKTITVKPHYDAVNTVSVNVINGSATGNKLTDNSAVKSSSVYISTNVDNFYAWANVKDDKYQIISYNKDYGYAAISDGNYTPVVKENGTYYVYTSDSQKTELKASMIDQFKNNSDYGLSPDQYFFTKLDNYAPFTYIEDDSKSADGKYRVFIRVTSGSNDEYKKAFDSFGVYGYGSKIPFTTVNEISGQYTFTSSVLPSDFNAYVSYKMTYTDKTGSYSITTTDFAKNA